MHRVVFKIQINSGVTNDKNWQALTICDISQSVSKEKISLQQNFSQQLVSSLCHEVMTPMNCIINLSEICIMNASMVQSLSIKQLKRDLTKQRQFLITLGSAAKFMRLMISSQMSCTKLRFE